MSQNKVYHINIEKETLQNDKFRIVLHTNVKQQLVIMSVKPLDDIPLEIHPEVDQFIRVEQGNGEAIIGLYQDKVFNLIDGDIIMIPAGTWHRIRNVSSTEPLKLYSIYSPPEHPIGRVNEVKPLGIYQSFTNTSIFKRLLKS
jgi:mannose-6-phosphate isomerase-like protein (cupin superfamily)